MNVNAIDFSILLPAFAAGLLVTATHVPLGTQVLARGIVFIDLAIAQIAGCGVLFADQLGFEAEGAAVQIAALAAALGGALLLTWTERVFADVQEAVIGVVFVLAATGSVLLLSSNVHGGEHLRDLLVGQILWAQPQPPRVGGRRLCRHPRALVRLPGASRPRGFLRAVRRRRHALGAAGRPVPRVRHAHRPAACDEAHDEAPPSGRLGARRRRLRGRLAAVYNRRPAERTDDRVGTGGAGSRRRSIQSQPRGAEGATRGRSETVRQRNSEAALLPGMEVDVVDALRPARPAAATCSST